MKKIIDDIEILNEELSEFINRPPSWWEKWGFFILLLILLIIISLSLFIKYPDKIVAPVTITSYQPPVKIYAVVDGYIEKLFVKDSQQVKSNQLIGVIKSSSVFTDVLFIDSLLKPEINDYKHIYNVLLNKLLILGELQSYYVDFQKAITNYIDFLTLSVYPKKINAKKNEYQNYIKYIDNLKKQYDIYLRSYEIANLEFKRDSILRIKNVISDLDFERSKNRLIEKFYELSKIEVEISSGKVNLQRIKQDIIDLQLEFEEKLNEYIIEVEKSKNILNAAISEWKKKYLFISPIDGIVAFTKYWHEDQYVFKNDLILTIIPSSPELIIGKLKVSPDGLGKVSTGMSVIVKLNNYPYYEFGSLKGYVTNISLVPIDNNYIIEIKFPEKLITNYNKIIPFNQEMSGMAEIITEKKSLMTRMISPLRYLLNYQKNLK